jgi:voltage-gated potassium channel
MHFIKIFLDEDDKWVGKRIADLNLPEKIILAAIRRNEKIIIPRGDVLLEYGDTVVLGAEPFDEHEHIRLKEIEIQKHNPWTNKRIRDLDISRHSIIVLVKRKNKALIPNGNMVLREFDNVFLYTQLHLDTVNEFDI